MFHIDTTEKIIRLAFERYNQEKKQSCHAPMIEKPTTERQQ